LVKVQYGVTAVPGPESEQPEVALSTYRKVVAACAGVGNANSPSGSNAKAHRPGIVLMLSS
jgi:hypothetical protein